MKILMMTNSYLPYSGGVAKSIASFSDRIEQKGHSVLIIAPEPDCEYEEENPERVFRVSTIKKFNDTNFPVTVPLPGELMSRLDEFKPEIIHSHFPFIIGNAAMRTAKKYNAPLVFTHHTMYEKYIHHINADSENIKTFVKSLVTGYANLCDLIIAPSRAVMRILKDRSIEPPITVIPTGIDITQFQNGNGKRFRKKMQINEKSFVLGYVGRLEPEKNLLFLLKAFKQLLSREPDVTLLIIGDGKQQQELEDYVAEYDMKKNVIFAGSQNGNDLVDAYHTMDVFTFSSKSETQGMVLAEAMSAGVPVIALDAPGVDDILKHTVNGYMVKIEKCEHFSDCIYEYKHLAEEKQAEMKNNAIKTSQEFSIDKCVNKVIDQYQNLLSHKPTLYEKDDNLWIISLEMIKTEWDIFYNYMNATGNLLGYPWNKQE